MKYSSSISCDFSRRGALRSKVSVVEDRELVVVAVALPSSLNGGAVGAVEAFEFETAPRRVRGGDRLMTRRGGLRLTPTLEAETVEVLVAEAMLVAPTAAPTDERSLPPRGDTCAGIGFSLLLSKLPLGPILLEVLAATPMSPNPDIPDGPSFDANPRRRRVGVAMDDIILFWLPLMTVIDRSRLDDVVDGSNLAIFLRLLLLLYFEAAGRWSTAFWQRLAQFTDISLVLYLHGRVAAAAAVHDVRIYRKRRRMGRQRIQAGSVYTFTVNDNGLLLSYKGR
mmetsp:Transcript_61343/g.150153  ORF Transcript_61343/g.150153 Transcript_61343/m.150153 type:complete len:281 (-) Transcript_61343:46-888(-)